MTRRIASNYLSLENRLRLSLSVFADRKGLRRRRFRRMKRTTLDLHFCVLPYCPEENRASAPLVIPRSRGTRRIIVTRDYFPLSGRLPVPRSCWLARGERRAEETRELTRVMPRRNTLEFRCGSRSASRRIASDR